ncbi:MAG: hypothetical protein AAF747_09960 [Planctomycetota bacterium]
MSARASAIAAFAVACLMIVGCTQPQLTRRHRQLEVADQHELVEASLFVAPNPPSSTLLPTLTERGQKAFIEAAASDDQLALNAEDFRKLLSRPIGVPSTTTDYRLVKRRLVFTAAKAWPVGTANAKSRMLLEPGNRISRLRHVVSNLSGAQFVAWDKFETPYETVELGTINQKQTAAFTPKFSPNLAGSVLGTAEVSGELRSELTEDLALRDRIVTVAGTMQAKSASVFQEGAFGIDLEGSVIADVTIRLDAGETADIFQHGSLRTNGQPTEAAKLSWSFLPVSFPAAGSDVEACYSADYVFRQVSGRQGARTVNEGDDSVVLTLGRAFVEASTGAEMADSEDEPSPVSVVLVSKGSLSRLATRYRIVALDGGQRRDLEIADTPIQFAELDDASAFVDWLELVKPIVIGKSPLFAGSTKLTKPIESFEIAPVVAQAATAAQ